MRKILVTILALTYLAVTCGVVINFHYCMDRLAAVSFFSDETEKCGRCGMDIHASTGCCRDEMQIVKLQDDQQRNLTHDLDIPLISQHAQVPSKYIVALFENNPEQRHFKNHSPPLISAQDTYLVIKVFRI